MNDKATTSGRQLTQSKLMVVRKTAARLVTGPLIRLIAKTMLTPNQLTWIGFIIIVVGAILVVFGHMLAAGFVVLGAAFFDLLDGALARSTNRVTPYGAVLDSSLDRAAEFLLFGAVIAFFAFHQGPQSTTIMLLSVIAMGASFLVSYVRARAEGAGLKCEVGLLTRAERIGLLVIGLWLSRINYALVVILSVIALLSFITAGQRLNYVKQQIKTE